MAENLIDDETGADLEGADPMLLDDGSDAESRARRRAWRERLNDRSSRQAIMGVIATLFGGAFWGFSGTSASFLFDNYQIDTMWLMAVRQLGAGAVFMIVALLFDRDRLFRLFTTPRHLASLLGLSLFGVFFNQLFYLLAVRYTNAGTATVLQCLQLVLIMAYACVLRRRAPRRRELAGVALAFAGTFFIATGGDPTKLAIPPIGLAVGLLAALGAACMSIIPTGILPIYGSSIVTGSAMFVSGVTTSIFVQPWNNVPALDATGWGALVVLIFVGSCLAYALYMQGVKDIGSVRASLLGTVEPISATVTSAIMLGTVFSGTDILGFALIIVMVFLTA
ncbi:MAG: EamA family transporter [Collinsella sp.]|nr:EamA family transporter [Collinsella sp.]